MAFYLKNATFVFFSFLFACNTVENQDQQTEEEQDVEVSYESFGSSHGVEVQVDEKMGLSTDLFMATGASLSTMFGVNAVAELAVGGVTIEEATPGLTCASVRPNGVSALSIDFAGCDDVQGTASVNRLERGDS